MLPRPLICFSPDKICGKMGRKYYVVWEGRSPGVYEDWEDALEQIENFPGAKYKGFASQDEAVAAFRRYVGGNETPLGEILVNASTVQENRHPECTYSNFPEIDLDGWAVDASCMGNPGVMEYRGVELRTGREIFRVGPFKDATNNIGEFLALVHALALQFRTKDWHTIYSDSATGMAWLRNKRVKTTLKQTAANAPVFNLLTRALTWISSHTWESKVRKWQTDLWGEIPADFGRK